VNTPATPVKRPVHAGPVDELRIRDNGIDVVVGANTNRTRADRLHQAAAAVLEFHIVADMEDAVEYEYPARHELFDDAPEAEPNPHAQRASEDRQGRDVEADRGESSHHGEDDQAVGH
jgi:hypothetical protein